MKQCRWLALSLILLLSLILTPAAGAADTVGAPQPQETGGVSEAYFVVRVYYEDPADLVNLKDFDLIEYNNTKEQYVLAIVDAAGFAAIENLGLRVEVDAEETAKLAPKDPLPGQEAGIPGYPCYRTVEETFQTAQDLVANHPTLASWNDVGDSWEKATPGGLPGYDMNVLVLTNSAIPGPKPKLFITASIHAREYTPAELVTRFAEYLVNNYGVDPDATWILDHHEIHLMLQANPDGRKQAETGISWRKNTNQNYCSPTSTSRGADLNRNFQFQWGCCNGSSGSQCSETYRGPSPASEPEVQAIQDYMRAIFPDQRADPLTSPAPDDATGVYLDIHSYSELVLWPWGFTGTVAPNGTALQTLGRKYAYFNNYTPEQAIGLYPTDGTTDDFGYGDLGVSSMTFELGTSFFQSCADFETTILPDNMQALLYAAKVVRTPYMTPAGPDALNVTAAPDTVTIGAPVVLTATVNDTRYNNSQGTEPSQAIAAAEYYIDTPPWQAGAVAHPMAAADGTFNSTIEEVTATINSGSLGIGRHLIFVRGKDAADNWGAFSAAFLDVQALNVNPTSAAVCAPANAVFTVNVGYNGSVTMSATGNPAGTTKSFNPNPVSGPGSSTLTIGNTGAATPGSYGIDVTGAYSGGSQTSTVHLHVANQPAGVPTLVSPANNAVDVSPTPTFSWNAASQAASYSFELATDAGLGNVVYSASGLTGTSYTPPITLNTSATYYWRVSADNACGFGGLSATFSFTTLVVPGDCSPGSLPNAILSEGFENGANGWTSSGTGNTWALWSTNVHGGSYAFHAVDSATVSDQRLVSPPIDVPAGQDPVTLKFWNRQVMEPRTGGCYDGGILEVSTNGGGSWTQILDADLLSDPYDGTVSTSYSNPLGGLRAWCGDPQDWLNSLVDVSDYAGQTVQFRFRLGSDNGVSREGWSIDDVVVQSCQVPCVYDVNGSGGVDILDVQLVAGAFGTNTPAYDFNHDNIVDVLDIQAVADRWQVGC
ncbi:MAG: M14 family zinc carboxypeptidase [Caldilineales bacterium]